ncbi:hypothetical protein RclHR1_00460007 [Rhizophagus clarus]|uniref:Uncharacterized protein n=1 Tax=Rhizophagus clarus TaxID=94130 RepID=A0A2Z6SCE9_9GLOM|nr:hypothetical protein RclHR1_00460007 [Rhizophagus clarus]GES73204.1 hypothetical protein GLOIN_2v1798535 [Rhizophagus clarus]
MIKPRILTNNNKKILFILNKIIENENDTSFIDYPVLIGSRAAKWHSLSFREPNDWDLVATPKQTALFIKKLITSAKFNIKLIYYPKGGLKLVGEYIETSASENEKPISFDIELVSDRVDLRNMKPNANLNKKDDDDKNDKDDNNSIVDHTKIEFEMFNDVRPKISSLMILELCCNIEDKMMIPLLSDFFCIVAPLKILEALKSSHIYWPTNFHKNIADLHHLRILLDYNKVSNVQPLCPQRDEQIELMLKTRIKETEIIRGIPGDHINLNMSNEDFLDNKDNLFVQRRVHYDDLHELVKYGNQPIYQGLKDDQSKAWIKKTLFEKLDYQTKLNCVKEEAMAIALERYLVPMLSKDQEKSYKSALARICTTLTKGWFRQFAIDNYPRLANLDKNLFSIAHTVIEKFPIKQKRPDIIVLDPETQAIFESIRPYTETISELSPSISGYDNDYRDVYFSREGIKITSPVNYNISITAIITTMCKSYYEACSTGSTWTASVVILPSKDLEVLSEDNKNEDSGDNENEDSDDNENEDSDDSDDNENEDRKSFDEDNCVLFKDPLNIHPYYNDDEECFSKLTSKHVFVVGISASGGTANSWSLGDDGSICIEVKSADYVASILEIPDLTGDLLFKYVLDYLKPTLVNSSDTPIKNRINELKVKGAIPTEPKQHVWYDAWNYELKKNFNH